MESYLQAYVILGSTLHIYQEKYKEKPQHGTNLEKR
jgi:hypothetical protein